jgi:hypothetical protein
LGEGVNRMVPSAFQVPPRPFGASASTCGVAPPMSTRFNLPAANNPIDRLSGAQNGNDAPSVAGRSCATPSDSEWIQIWEAPRPRAATSARYLPSGERASCAAAATGDGDSVVFSGGAIANRTVGGSGMVGVKKLQAAAPPARNITIEAAAIAAPITGRGGIGVSATGLPGSRSVCAIHSVSRATSLADCHRRSGSLARQTSTT